MNIRLRQLEALIAVVESGSVTAASKTLSLTQSSTSKLLSGLEEEVGFLIFDRVGRSLRLTDRGRMILRQARQALDAFDDVKKTAAEIRDNQGRRLRVSAIGPLSFGSLVPKAVAQVAKRHPGFSLSFETKFRIDIEDWVAQGHSDLGFTLLPLTHQGLNARAFAPVRAVAVVPVDHTLAGRSHLEPADLAGESMIMPQSAARVRGLVDANFVSAGFRLSPRIETSNATSAVHLVSQGAGVSVLDPFSCQSVQRGEVRLIPWVPETPLIYGMIWQNNRTLSALENQVFDSVAQNFAAFDEAAK